MKKTKKSSVVALQEMQEQEAINPKKEKEDWCFDLSAVVDILDDDDELLDLFYELFY